MSAKDVLVASPATATGGILAGDLGTALPTDASMELDEALVPHGYVGEEGLTMTTNRTTERIRAWGGSTVRVVQTEHDVTFSFMLLETSVVTAEAVFGEGNVTFTPAGAGHGNKLDIVVTDEVLPHKAWLFNIKDGRKAVRVAVPNGQITEVGDTAFVHSNATGWQVTLEAFEDESGAKAYIYSDDGESEEG